MNKLTLLACLSVCSFFLFFTGPVARYSGWFQRGTAVTGLVLSSEPWRAVTALTLHADTSHVLGNAISGTVFDEASAFPRNCNKEMVNLFPLEDPEEVELVHGMVRKHAEYTGSERSWQVLALWDELVRHYNTGVEQAHSLETRWRSLAGKVDEERYQAVLAKLQQQVADAEAWRDKCLKYFQQFSKGEMSR